MCDSNVSGTIVVMLQMKPQLFGYRGKPVIALLHAGTLSHPPLVRHRALKVEETCPIQGCVFANCEVMPNGEYPGYKCSKCQGSLLVIDNACGCPAGRYGDYVDCLDCPKGPPAGVVTAAYVGLYSTC